MVIFHSICKRLPEDNDFVAVAVLGKLHRLTTGGTVADQAIDIGGISPDFPRDHLGWCQFWMFRGLNHPLTVVEEDMYRIGPIYVWGKTTWFTVDLLSKTLHWTNQFSVSPVSPRISGYIMIYHSLSVMFIHFPNNGHNKKTGHFSAPFRHLPWFPQGPASGAGQHRGLGAQCDPQSTDPISLRALGKKTWSKKNRSKMELGLFLRSGLGSWNRVFLTWKERSLEHGSRIWMEWRPPGLKKGGVPSVDLDRTFPNSGVERDLKPGGNTVL